MAEYGKTPREPGKKQDTCPCLQLQFRAGHDWRDPAVLRRGRRIQRFGQMFAYEFQIQTKVWVVLTCANNPTRTCSGKVECKVTRQNFTDKNGAALPIAGVPVVVPASQDVTNDCNGRAKNILTGFTVVFFFVAPPQNNPAPRPPGVGVTDLIINGDIDLEFKLSNCPGPPGIAPPGTWKMKLKIKGSNLDIDESNYDGDAKKNKDEGAPGDTPRERRKKMFKP